MSFRFKIPRTWCQFKRTQGQNGTKCCQNRTERRQNGTKDKTGRQTFVRLVYRMTQMRGQFRTKRRQNGTTYQTGRQIFLCLVYRMTQMRGQFRTERGQHCTTDKTGGQALKPYLNTESSGTALKFSSRPPFIRPIPLILAC